MLIVHKIRDTATRQLLFSHNLYVLTCELLLSTIIIVCKQLSCDSVKDNDLFLSIFIAGTAIHSLIVKEELRNYCQQMGRRNKKL